MIEFTSDPNVRFWSQFVFWYAVVNVGLTLAFTVVVTLGGIGDLRFLLKALNEPNPPGDEAGNPTMSSEAAPPRRE